MIAYIDSSVLLRIALNQPNQLKEFSKLKLGISSRLLKSECLHTIDRLAAMQQLSQAALISASEYLFEVFDHVELISVSENILERVGEPLGLNLGTLDGIHLFSAVTWRWQKKKDLVFLTHDVVLGKAAQMLGFRVLGI